MAVTNPEINLNKRVSPNITHCGGQALGSVQFHQKEDLAHEHCPSGTRQGTRASLGFGTLLPGRVSDRWRQ